MTGLGTLEAKAGRWREGHGRRRGLIQEGQGEALTRQGVGKTKGMEEGMGRATSQAGHMVSRKRLGTKEYREVEEANPGKPSRTRSGRSSKERSQQGSSCFCDNPHV